MQMQPNPMLKIALTANLVEWYEFSLTSFMALQIGQIFFPVATDKTAIFFSFTVFAVSYLARPFGGIFFGILGNRYGTGTALKISMIGMSIPASTIFILPTYKMAGYFATSSLLLTKILQGFCAGGELPLSGYFVSLNTDNKNRGFYSSLVVVSGFIGMLLASTTVSLLPYLNVQQSKWFGVTYLSDSWRWPFLLCIPLSIAIFFLRSSIDCTNKNNMHVKYHEKTGLPLLQAFILVAFMEAVIYSVVVWMPQYLHTYLRISAFDAHITNVITIFIFSFAIICVGYASRFFGAGKFVLIGVVSLTFTSYPLFLVLQKGDFLRLLLVQIAFACMTACVVGVIFVILTDLFRKSWGNLGMSSTYSIATAIFGGASPLICTYLVNVTHLLIAPAFYLLSLGLLAAPVAYRMSLTACKKVHS
ncbi:MFS transporter [Robbsia andropogonis]|uniref:MFS transporter n=1 Tax=Robbsia andropogonis TaxID=28092 RepID=UPI000467457D|nr:MFS transporter [Robbsia andropogonis]